MKDNRKNETCYRRWVFDKPKNGKKREKTYFPKGKKMPLKKAFDIVVQGLLAGKGLHPSVDYIWYAEKISAECNVHVDLVRQVLHKLNLEGCCSKRILWDARGGMFAMHTRLDWGDAVVLWEAKQYSVYMNKLQEKYGE
ncbi:hypothetical protein [Yersinia phage fHe-Yen9-04]|uniref:Uncharacterized protein n=1 Tax=Yersinia phage fHe-Yen9-04 TaxID=2052742 RepID=A0A2C9CYJ2_9CAUD|nr:hypothetical protein FDJ41_gp131 [Yersinia phage fHe-Yen9-04]SOK58408.1 hypothetical protein [Yersinia phage fHe-Yen9-04]VUE36177.1 hypothetical protein [Yersinia phage fHe-Yen9-04]